MAASCKQTRFPAVYAHRFGFVRRSLGHLGVRPADLDDALQETFVAAYRHWNGFRPDGDERAWLYGIARRIAFRYRRSVARRARLVAVYEPDPCVPQAPDHAVAQRESEELLQAFLERLDPPKRDVFILSRLSGMTGAEVASALGINANTMWSRLRSANLELERFANRHRARNGGIALVDAARVDSNGAADEQGRVRVWLLLAKLPRAAALKTAVLMVAALLCTGAVGSGPVQSSPSEWPVSSRRSPSRTSILTGEHRRSGAASVDPDEYQPQVLSQLTAVENPSPAPPRTQRSRSAKSPQRVTASGLAEEAKLLRQVRVALRDGLGQRAVAELKRYEKRFPNGALANEAQALRIRALCVAGHEDRARSAARTGAKRLPGLAAVATQGCTALSPTKISPAGEVGE